MYKLLKIKGDESNIFFIADGHIGQSCKNWSNPLWAARGYDSPESHTKGFIDNWNKVCNDNSIIFHLGDFVFEDPDAVKFWGIIEQLKFSQLHLLKGNHFSGQKKAYYDSLQFAFPDLIGTDTEVYPLRVFNGGRTIRTIIFWPEYLEVIVNKTPLVLCHYCIAAFNGQADYCIHLSGHSHSNLPMSNKDTGQGRRLDVGADSFGRPISLTEVKEHLKNRNLDILDHHISQNEKK